MTEGEWLAAVHPQKMLDFLDSIDALTDRKQRLLDCACVRRIWHLLTDDARNVVEIAERYADGFAELDEMTDLRGQILAAAEIEAELNIQAINNGAQRDPIGSPNRYSALSAAAGVAWEYSGGTNPLRDAANALSAEAIAYEGPVRSQPIKRLFVEQRNQTDIVREVFGNPFRAADFLRDWRTDTVTLLARTMYESREFSAMPILADALQDAGCDNDDILDHCRGPGPHVRGCWVVDLILGKE